MKSYIVINEARPYYDLQCPRKDCNGAMTINRADLLVSAFLTRPCFHCFRVSRLPKVLRIYVRKYARK